MARCRGSIRNVSCFSFFGYQGGSGKKQIAQLSFFEYVTGITIGSIAAEGIMGLDGNMYLGLLAIVIVALLPFLSGSYFFKKQKIPRFYRRQGNHIHKRRKSYGR